MEKIKIGIIGLGTVGTGTIAALRRNRELINKRLGASIEVKRIAVRDIRRPRQVDLPPGILTEAADEIVHDPEIAIVVELIGGIEPARSYILAALRAGKCVVTANKALLAECGQEIYQAAAEAGTEVAFEASVGGGIPIIKTLREALAANRILSLLGIVNGTCNYILTRMTEAGLSFNEALTEAQKAGFAEADPSLDVEGLDSAHKLAILATLAYDTCIPLQEIYVEGITAVEPLDIRFGRELGYVVKLLALSRETDGGIEVRVHPTLVPEGHMLASVREAHNAFYITGDTVGDILLYGQGAGAWPTGSAVCADIIDLARAIRRGKKTRLGPPSFRQPRRLLPMEEVVSRYYFRFSAVDRPGVLSKIAGVLGDHRISIASVIQKGRDEGGSVPIVMITHEAREADVRQALRVVNRLEVVTAATKFIRILEG
ncbi:MAG TPA: homoserine dehydrogenase [Thermodesulfatator sp.]|nr:homoserine dehydrogenase [Thermodesulfatator sp.]